MKSLIYLIKPVERFVTVGNEKQPSMEHRLKGLFQIINYFWQMENVVAQP